MSYFDKPGAKYGPLFQHLRQSGRDEVTLSFAEIEALLGERLPESARTSRSWWSNRTSGAVQASAWMKAGYHVKKIDLAQGTITFRKPVRVYKVKRKGETVLWNSDLIKGLREHLGLSQAQLAQVLGVRQQTISEWETGMYAPSLRTSKHLGLIAREAQFEYETLIDPPGLQDL
jgi:DNA-binding XRE family transcriptional regulator